MFDYFTLYQHMSSIVLKALNPTFTYFIHDEFILILIKSYDFLNHPLTVFFHTFYPPYYVYYSQSFITWLQKILSIFLCGKQSVWLSKHKKIKNLTSLTHLYKMTRYVQFSIIFFFGVPPIPLSYIQVILVY